MRKFLDENFLLQTKTAEKLYHDFAKDMPIIDFHCHLPPDQIASNIKFPNLTRIWLSGDHYKWRAMRANGINEKYITGDSSDLEKFESWAHTVPCTLRNPLYHWTHLELQRYFGITKILNSGSCNNIYDDCNKKLKTDDYSVRNLLLKMRVQRICTTDDPTDRLEHHQKINNDFEIKVYPTFRPDKAMTVDDVGAFNLYVEKLESVSNIDIVSYDDYLRALKQRHDFFATNGCCISDHGLEFMYAATYSENEIQAAFNKIRNGRELSETEQLKFKSAMLYQFAIWDWEKGWVQQFHLGALRNNNPRMLKILGVDSGYDSIGDFEQGKQMAKFLGRLDETDQLAKTIIYNLNPSQNELMAAMCGNFNSGNMPGKIQFGSAWWFLDQKDGMEKQLNTLSNLGLISRFVGMLTDSRSFLSYPRHEYFRRILCNLFGKEIEDGELPNDITWTGKVIKNICYNNANEYFNWQHDSSAKKVSA